MKNFSHAGRTCTFAAPYDVTSGSGFLQGSWFGVANANAKAGDDVEGDVDGVFDLPKSTAAGSAVGAYSKVYWDDANKVCTGASAGNKLIGATLKTPAADGDAMVHVRLNGNSI